ncbi:helix-turn-helix domain-containing protein [Cellulosimicrobium cellulans]|uniref:winged helix-turn-helix transcriptional regulator n=1 Tax=Cellulosimicrobium cellulans TaxID=1710 RepID=UPI0028AAC4AB|nr:helix-turn-helix domain-containing protein [Cellulosimicrobium cellulans]
MTTTPTTDVPVVRELAERHGLPLDGGCAAAEATSEVRSVLDRVGDKWSVLILGMLSGGPQRFTGLLHGIDGISQRMLTLNLRQLERDGLVSRTVHAVVPPRVDYALTDLGATLLPPVLALVEWALENTTIIRDHRDQFDARATSAG